jgi:energy-coupling factor transport system substrate-specific component
VTPTGGDRCRDRVFTTVLLLLASAVGLGFFLAPFLGGPVEGVRTALTLFVSLLGTCLLVLVARLETGATDSRLLAALGILAGLNATLRLLTGPAGVSAVFFLPIVAGFVFGAEFGFLLGVLSILVSALVTSGLGPWLPFQMLATGWSGMVAGWLPRLGLRLRGTRWEGSMLAVWGAASGLLFGALLNLWFWPFLGVATGGGEGWQGDLGTAANLRRYLAFYLTTSLWWDVARALGNVVLLTTVGPPVIRLLDRFARRFRYRVEPPP